MGKRVASDTDLRDFVLKMGDEHPPIQLGSVDRTIHDPEAVRRRFAGVIDYLARVELEVERNVLELLTIIPDASEVDRIFYRDVWSHQEIAHGKVLDQLKADAGLEPAEPFMSIPLRMKVLGAMAHWEPIHDISRMLYYLTGASTERQAVLAYNSFNTELEQMGEDAIAKTIIQPIKRQEPAHFAFYRMSAERMVANGELKPWQLWLARLMRQTSFTLVGVDYVKAYQKDMGEVIVSLGFDDELEAYAKEIGRLEAKVLWANRNGMEFPPYFLKALRDSIELYRDARTFERPNPHGFVL